jgi:hypothetical protein
MTNFTLLSYDSSEAFRGLSGEPNSKVQILSPHPSRRIGMAMGGLKASTALSPCHASGDGTPIQTRSVRFSTANHLIASLAAGIWVVCPVWNRLHEGAPFIAAEG